MLNSAEIEFADGGFCVYDHDWRFFSEFLGEPFLIGDYLAYFDGRVLYLCAFPLGDCTRERPLNALLDELRESFSLFTRVEGVNIWGRFTGDLNERCPLPLIERSSYGVTDLHVLLRSFAFETQTAARLARNAAKNKGVQTSVVRLERLSWEHLRLLELFFATHAVGVTHASFYLAVASLIRLSTVVVVEGRVDGELLGFAVVSIPSVEVVSVLMGFYNNARAARVSDGIMSAIIEWSKARGAGRMHLGYSVSASLAQYKRKWSPLSGPTFSEAFFARSADLASLFRKGGFPWRERLFLRAAVAGGAAA